MNRLLLSLLLLCGLENRVVAGIDHQKEALEQLRSMSDLELDKNLKLQDFFGSIYVINLPHAKARLERMTRELQQVGIENFTVWRAVNGRNSHEVPEALWRKMSLNWRVLDLSTVEGEERLDRQFQGETGCYLSHYRLLQHVKTQYDMAREKLLMAKDEAAKELAERELKKYSTVLILEDDNGFGLVSKDHKSVTMQGVGRILREALASLPEDWDMLYFMAQSISPAQMRSPHLKQLNFGMLMNAYAVNHQMYDDLIKHLSSIDDPEVVELAPIDNAVGALHATHRCYAIFPSIAYQHDGQSQIIDQETKGPRQVQP